MANLVWAELLEKAGEEIARVVHQNVDSAELRDGSLNGRLRILRVCDVELESQRVVMVAHRGGNLRSIAASRDNGVAGGQGSLGDVDSQASTSAGDEPHSLCTHGMSPCLEHEQPAYAASFRGPLVSLAPGCTRG